MAGIDEYVKLSIHSDTTDGSTTFVDSSAIGRTITSAGTVHHETDQYKFGATSIYFPGSSYLSCASSADFNFGTGDFTIDLWLRLETVSGNQYIVDLGSNGGTIQYSGGLIYYNPSTGTSSPLYTTKPQLSINTWYHVAIVRASGTTKLYLNGVLQATGTDTRNFPNATLNLGRYGGGGNYLVGYLDEVRISKGIARWTADFTPPTEPYSSNKVSGIVTVNGSPAAKTVAVFLRSDFTLLGTTTSDASTGVFEISHMPLDANALLVTAIDSTGTYNAVSVDYITSVEP